MISTLAMWPAQKNLGTLMSCSAAVLLGSQFWKAHDGGLFMAWYLPVLLLVVFRPNLENRVALAMLDPNWMAAWRRILRRTPKDLPAG
jgi:pilus assembly protein TadC